MNILIINADAIAKNNKNIDSKKNRIGLNYI